MKPPMSFDYLSVTELAGDEVSQEQVKRLCNRYYWAASYCMDKDVVEAACGTGQGLAYLDKRSKTFEAGDYSAKMLKICQLHYKNRIKIQQFDAQEMPFRDRSKDVIVLFEALYYLADALKFVKECRRVLRTNGVVLIATANKDLYDFNPSPYSYKYYGTTELNALFSKEEFSVQCYGDTPVSQLSQKQKLLRPFKKAVVNFGLMPKSMTGKKILKRLVFGKMVTMPVEIDKNTASYVPPVPINVDHPDTLHKVIYCEAVKKV